MNLAKEVTVKSACHAKSFAVKALQTLLTRFLCDVMIRATFVDR
jgi:hypothetical protein